ncbi:MAG: hypothetical protein DRR42_24005 [Gammaproteobacteria bacterium]|nr:MAG: hypothetical protein DRR42_24005 [Gammaproteobacteria bacterium]
MFIDYQSISSEADSKEVYFVFSDQIGTPSLIENRDCSMSCVIDINPFGNCSIGESEVTLNLRFPGHYYDHEICLFYNRFRYYDAGLGRYLQSDPWGIGGGSNLYAYGTNPLDRVDVRGLGEEHCKKLEAELDQESTEVIEIEFANLAYSSAEDAAIAAMQRANPVSVGENLEHGGWISKNADGFFVINPHAVGTDVALENMPGPGLNGVVWWHTHGATQKGYDKESFSGAPFTANTDGDRGYSQVTNSPGYLATPTGTIKKYDPKTDTVTTLTETAPP